MNKGPRAKLTLLLCSAAFCLIVAEVGARFAQPSRYYVWPPNTHRTNDIPDEFQHGVWGPTSFTVNEEGMRGDAYHAEQHADYRYRILALGGSTTICALLDDAVAWPHAVQEIVDKRLGANTVFVGNVGRPGHTTAQHVLQTEKLLAQYDDVDAILLLAGVNDMVIQLNVSRGLIKFKLAGKPDPLKNLQRAFSVVPASLDGPWYARSALAAWIRTRTTQLPATEGPLLDPQGFMFLKQTKYRQRATSFVDELPDLTKLLQTYEVKLNEIIDHAQARGVRPILLTQPSIWRDGLSEEVEERLWMGGPPLNMLQENGEYLTVRVLAEAMAAYNRTMLDVCAARRIECIDLASALPKQGDIFWDDVHYTNRGSRLLAEIVANQLLEAAPLAR
jgi:hypothetical protein